MSYSRGRESKPGQTQIADGQNRKFFSCVACALLLAFATIVAQAQQPTPLTLAEAERIALTAEPGQLALLAQSEALGEQAVASNQLPDPTLRVGLENYPVPSGGFTKEGMTHAKLSISQAFPAGKTRAASMRQFSSMSLEMSDSAEARGRDVLTDTRNAWLEYYYWQRASKIVIESRPFFSDLARITRSLYAVGSKSQYDVLRSELELSRLDDRLIDIDRQQKRARAALAEWIGNQSDRPAASQLPVWGQPPPQETLHERLLAHPVVTAADARVAAQLAEVDVAKEKFKPGWAIDVGYGFRNGSAAPGVPLDDLVSVSVTMDLPVFRKNRQNRELAAALGERRAAQDSREQLLRHLRSQVDTEYAQWQDLTMRLQLYDERILSQAEGQAQAALLAYQSDTGDFADVMRGYIDDLNTRLEYIRLQVDRDQSYAVLANLGGISQ